MGIKRIVSTSFWTDDNIIERFSPEDRYFYLYLMTNPHTTQLGVYLVTFKQMAFETGYTTDVISTLIDRFQNVYGVIKYSATTREIAIKNYLRYGIVKGGKPVFDLLLKEIATIQDKSLLGWVHDSLAEHDDLNETVKCILPYLAQQNAQNSSMEEPSRESQGFNPTIRRSSTPRFVGLQGGNEVMINEGMKNELMINEEANSNTKPIETEQAISLTEQREKKDFDVYTEAKECCDYNAGVRPRDDDAGAAVKKDERSEECEGVETPFARFVKRWGIKTRSLSNYSAGKVGGIDWDAISDEVQKSSYLQQQKALSFYIDHANDILDGKYFDFERPQMLKRSRGDTAGADNNRRVYEQVLESIRKRGGGNAE